MINLDSRLAYWKQKFNPWLIFVILLSSYIPIIGVQLYFRHDDSQTLLWAHEFTGSILNAFNPELWLGEYYKYPGVGGYYRPFESVFVMFLLNLFGPKAFYFQFVNGVLVIGTIVFMYKIAALFSNKVAAFATVVVFHLCFNSILYGNYHIVVPFGYFFELGCFYFAARGLVKNDYRFLLLSLIFLIPATNRQTTAVILPVLVTVYLISYWRDVLPGSKAKYALPAISLLPNLMLPFSSNSSSGTILGATQSLDEMLNFLNERLLFYGGLLTNGITGIIIILILTAFTAVKLLHSIGFWKNMSSRPDKLILSGVLVICVTLAIITAQFAYIGLTYMFSILAYMLITNKRLRFAGAWFFVSLGCFLAIVYYHGAYFLEAAYGLSIVLGIILFETGQKILEYLGIKRWIDTNSRNLAVVGLVFFVGFSIPILKTKNVPWLSNKVEAVRILIDTNQNFEEMLNYLAEEIPRNSEVYTLTNADLGISDKTWRFWSLKDRAEKVKVMNIDDTEAMLKVLGRYDMKLKSASELQYSNGEAARKYFIACSNFEKEKAVGRYSLELLKRFKRGKTEAAVYLLN